MDYFNPVNIVMFPGARAQILADVNKLNVLVFCSKGMLSRLYKDQLLKGFGDLTNIEFEHNFNSNPALTDLTTIAERHSSKRIDLVLGIGGGSAMDVAKISAVTIPALTLGYSLVDLLEDNRLFQKLEPIDCFQIPTTAGTGSEVTPFATVWDYSNNIKKSLSHPKMFAKKAIIDSELLHHIPTEVALSTGLDALIQAMESIWNVNSNELTRTFSVKAAVCSFRSMLLLDELSSNPSVAEDLALASLLAGLSISQTRTAICHSISYPLTLKFGLPHGLACGFSMLEVLKFNADSVRINISAIEQYLKGKTIETAIEEIFTKYDFYSLMQEYLTSRDSVLALLPEMVAPGRAGNNIRRFTEAELEDIVRNSCIRAELQS